MAITNSQYYLQCKIRWFNKKYVSKSGQPQCFQKNTIGISFQILSHCFYNIYHGILLYISDTLNDTRVMLNLLSYLIFMLTVTKCGTQSHYGGDRSPHYFLPMIFLNWGLLEKCAFINAVREVLSLSQPTIKEECSQ